MNLTNNSTDGNENQQHSELISLIPSGFESPQFKASLLNNYFMTPYQRQILRSQYSDCIQKMEIEKKDYYIIIYDSEIQVIKFEGEKMHQKTTQVFCSFALPLQQRKNPKIVQFLMLDRSNKLMILEFDYIRETTPNFPTREDEELEMFGKFENEIFEQVLLSKDGELLLLISKQKLYYFNLLNQSIKQIKNPLNQKNHSSQSISKPFLQFSYDKKHVVVAERNQIVIITDYDISNRFSLEKNQHIINIKLSQNQLFIVTNKAILRILNISNDLIKLQKSDYFYLEEDINYAHFEIETNNIDDNKNFILLIYQSGEVVFIDIDNQQNGKFPTKKLNIKIDSSFIVKYIKLEYKTKQSIRFRIFYFTQQKQLGSIICQGNI